MYPTRSPATRGLKRFHERRLFAWRRAEGLLGGKTALHRVSILPGSDGTVMGTCLLLDFFLLVLLATLSRRIERDGSKNAATSPERLVAHVLLQTNLDITSQQSRILRLLDQMVRGLIHPNSRPHDPPRHFIVRVQLLHVQALEFFNAVEVEHLLTQV